MRFFVVLLTQAGHFCSARRISDAKENETLKKLIPTKTHGVLDYLSVGLLIALPRIMKWDSRVTNLLTASAVGTLVYSLFTDYELGAVRLLPMKTHLALDAASGVALTAAPLAFLNDEKHAEVKATLLALGLFEIVTPLLTDTEPGDQ